MNTVGTVVVNRIRKNVQALQDGVQRAASLVKRGRVAAATGAGFQADAGLQNLTILVAHGFSDFDGAAHAFLFH
jgi:hypothetical protein